MGLIMQHEDANAEGSGMVELPPAYQNLNPRIVQNAAGGSGLDEDRRVGVDRREPEDR